MVWPNAGFGIAISAFDISENFRLRSKIDMHRTQSQFQALQKFVNDHFYSRPLVPLCSQLTPWFAGITRV